MQLRSTLLALAVALALCSAPSSAFAARAKSTASMLPESSGANSLSIAPSPARSAEVTSQASLGITSLTYMAPAGALELSQFSIARFNGQFHRIGDELEIHAETQIGAGINCGWTCSSVEFPQLSIGSSRRLGTFSGHLGRVLVPWSKLDEQWNLGLYQPRFVYDFLHPKSVGLMGVFGKWQTENWQLTMYASPFFIPDRGLPVSVQNGRVASIDPFFHAPISEVVYEGRSTPVKYDLHSPPLEKLLARPGFGATTQWGSSDRGLALTASYAYKPVNQVLLAYSNLYNLSFEVADADLYPRVVMHHLASADLSYASGATRASLSALREVPDMDVTPTSWTAQSLESAWLVSPQFEVRGKSSFKFLASYLHVQGGNAPDRKADKMAGVSSGESVFNPRYPFLNAFKVSAEDFVWKHADQSIKWRAQLMLDLDQQSKVYSHTLTFQPAETWQMRLAADILVGKESGTDFISKNRANDRLFGSLNYVF